MCEPTNTGKIIMERERERLKIAMGTSVSFEDFMGCRRCPVQGNCRTNEVNWNVQLCSCNKVRSGRGQKTKKTSALAVPVVRAGTMRSQRGYDNGLSLPFFIPGLTKLFDTSTIGVGIYNSITQTYGKIFYRSGLRQKSFEEEGICDHQTKRHCLSSLLCSMQITFRNETKRLY